MWLKIKSTFAHLLASNEDSQDAFDEGLHEVLYGRIPTNAELKKMSAIKLAKLLSSSINGSPKFFFVEREYKRRLADDQAKINRKNILLGAIIGGIFTIIGYLLKN